MSARPPWGWGSAAAVLPSPPSAQFTVLTPTAPPAAAPAAAAGDPAACCGFDWNQIRYEEFSSEDSNVGLPSGVSVMPVVFTRPAKAGYFWFVLAMGYRDPGGNARQRGFFLMPPHANGPQTMNQNFFYKDSISGQARSEPKVGIRLAGSFIGNTSAQNNEHVGAFVPSTLIIPPLWSVMLAQDDANDAPGAPTGVIMQVAYAELPIGTPVPYGG
jgi:hypothetical protein